MKACRRIDTSLVCKAGNEGMTKNRHTSLVCKAGNEGMTKNMETPTLCAKLVMKACRRIDTSLVCKAGNKSMTKDRHKFGVQSW